MDGRPFGELLVARGLLSPEDLEDALRLAAAPGPDGRPRLLLEVLVDRKLLDPVRLDDLLGGLQRRRRTCAKCAKPVLAPRLAPEGERCGRCGGPIAWVTVPAPPMDGPDDAVLRNAGDLPSEVRGALNIAGSRFGKYVFLEEAGRGGGGVVFRAWDLLLAQTVAVKLVLDAAPNGDRATGGVPPLIREARNAARLRHPHIVPILEAGIIENQIYIAMDYVQGGTLDRRFKAARRQGQLSPLYLEPQWLLRLLADVGDAAEYAHRLARPVYHCDFKPGNILVDEEGRGFVADFGLARAAEGRAPRAPQSRESDIAGTVGYMAPEQILSDRSRIGPWTDLYSLGVILYEALAGRLPYAGGTFEVMEKTLNSEPEAPLEIARKAGQASRIDEGTLEALQRLTLRCLEKRPDRRPQSAAELAESLGALADAVRTPSAATRTTPPAPRPAGQPSETQVRRDAKKRLSGEALGDLQGRVIRRINERRPSLASLELLDRTLEPATLTAADEYGFQVQSKAGPQRVTWSELPPRQFVSLIVEGLSLDAPEDRLALGIYCLEARFVARAREFFRSLAGTELEATGKSFLE